MSADPSSPEWLSTSGPLSGLVGRDTSRNRYFQCRAVSKQRSYHVSDPQIITPETFRVPEPSQSKGVLYLKSDIGSHALHPGGQDAKD